MAPAQLLLGCSRHPSKCPIVTSQMLLLQHCDVIENNNIGNNEAIPLAEKFNFVQEKIPQPSLNQWFTQAHAWWLPKPMMIQFTNTHTHIYIYLYMYIGPHCENAPISHFLPVPLISMIVWDTKQYINKAALKFKAALFISCFVMVYANSS